MSEVIDLMVLPRETMAWEEFLRNTPENSIGLDGVVLGGPAFDEKTRHANFDHHDGVVREATMSTCKQVYLAIKGGLFQSFREDGRPRAHVYVNDCDQDTALALWELRNYKLLEGTQSIPHMNRLISLTDELDITGGSFPRNLDEELARQHNWVFDPYNQLRKSGSLAGANEGVIRDNLEATLSRVGQFLMGQSGEKPLDVRYEVLYESPHDYRILNEIGGNEARYVLFSRGMNAFISLVATRPGGNRVWSVGRRSRYIPFPVKGLYDVYNEAEGLTRDEGWGGSDIVGGSSRKYGSKLDHEQLAELTDGYLDKRSKIQSLRPLR